MVQGVGRKGMIGTLLGRNMNDMSSLLAQRVQCCMAKELLEGAERKSFSESVQLVELDNRGAARESVKGHEAYGQRRRQ